MASDLNAIRLKVRRITRSPSQTLLSDADINEYINTFVLYDFPAEVRLFDRKQELTLFTDPNRDLITIAQPSPVITFHPPVYIAGYEAWYEQDPDTFYSQWPRVQSIVDTQLQGNGIQNNFIGVLNQVPVLPREVTFTSIGLNNIGLELFDDGNGLLLGSGFGTINYLTGAFNLTFAPNVPANGAAIFSQTFPYVAGRPVSLLFYHNEIILRPVPDMVYKIQIQVQTQPTELLANNQSPDLQQWWQYIAYGAAKKVFEDRNDIDSVSLIMPEFKKQERLVLRTTIVQQTNERVSTIYTQNGSGFSRGGGLF